VTSEVDEEEEAEDHADGEGNATEEDSIDANTKEGLDNITDKLEEAIDVLTGERDVLVSKVALGFLTLEEGNDVHDIENKSGKKSEESDPADETDDGEVVADEEDEEDVDNNEASKRWHEVVPHEDLLGLGEEWALLEGLGDLLPWALTRAGRCSLRGLFLGLFLGFLSSRSFFLLGFLNGFLRLSFRGDFRVFFRHDL